MSPLNLVVACTFGLESLVAEELRELGYDDLSVENGRVCFTGDMHDIATCNLWLRTADRVGIIMGEFEAHTFDELFDGTAAIAWEDLMPRDAFMHVNGRSQKSQLTSVPACQSIVKKAVVSAMQRRYRNQTLPETGAHYRIEISLLKDKATLTLDTTGPSLHKRGYREEAGDAPLKETMAAALVMLSRWDPSRVLADPCCGSGTILIEAATLACRMAPGRKRKFSAEGWEWIPREIWSTARIQARQQVQPQEFRLLGSDIDGRVLAKARENAANAGVEELISFQVLPADQFRSRKRYGCLITNPPYGERLGELETAETLYRELGVVYHELPDWSAYILSPHRELEKLMDCRADKKRKLFNGRIECHYNMFFGPRPPREFRSESESE